MPLYTCPKAPEERRGCGMIERQDDIIGMRANLQCIFPGKTKPCVCLQWLCLLGREER